jgi:hypothetical protein
MPTPIKKSYSPIAAARASLSLPSSGRRSAWIPRSRKIAIAEKVLISDTLSPAAIAIFRERGIQADLRPELGKDKPSYSPIAAARASLSLPSSGRRSAWIPRSRKIAIGERRHARDPV